MRLRLYIFIMSIIDAFKFRDCHKTDLGYNCHHRVYKNGKKECG